MRCSSSLSYCVLLAYGVHKSTCFSLTAALAAPRGVTVTCLNINSDSPCAARTLYHSRAHESSTDKRRRQRRVRRRRLLSTVGPIQAKKGGTPGGFETDTVLTDVTVGGGIDMEPPNALQAGLEGALDLLGGSTQWVVAGSVAAALVTRADADTLMWVLGSLFNAFFSKVLKKTINQVRPDGSQLKDPGMPSSHAMSLFFLGTYLVIALQQYGVTDSVFQQWPLSAPETQASIILYAVTASLWRVKAGFHTLPQVSVGAVVGTLDAAAWYYVAQVCFTPQVEQFLGGGEVPMQVSLSICVVTFFTFGNVRRRIDGVLNKAQDKSGVDVKEL